IDQLQEISRCSTSMRFAVHRRGTRCRSGACFVCVHLGCTMSSYPSLSASPSGRAPGESERIPWPPGPRPTNTFSPPRSARALSQRPIVGGECRCAPRSRPVIVATRRRPYGRRRAVMLSLVRALRIEIQNESLSLSLSLSPIRRYGHLSDMCLAYLIARVRPSLSLVPHAIAVAVAAAAGAAFYARTLASEGGLAR
ncbi:hypothetical protein ALC60_03389, partial [Trachymyrmex zeteki]